jgi:hypothetical protein
MSVLPSDLVFYGSANMPDVDGATTGGAVNTAILVGFNDITPSGTMNYVSSSASDTGVVLTLSGRDSTGVIQSEAKTLTGTTPVTGTQSFERLMKGVASGTGAVGDVACISNTAVVTGTAQAGLAATGSASVSVNRDWATVPSSATTYGVYHGMLFDILPNRVTQNRRLFYNVASDVTGGSSRSYWEKIFAVNNSTVTALTVASIAKQADIASGAFQFQLTNALNDTATVANRQTAPATGVGSLSTGSAPQSIAVPSPGNLPPGAAPNAAGAQGVWVNLVLAAGLAAAKVTETMRINGTTT